MTSTQVQIFSALLSLSEDQRPSNNDSNESPKGIKIQDLIFCHLKTIRPFITGEKGRHSEEKSILTTVSNAAMLQ